MPKDARGEARRLRELTTRPGRDKSSIALQAAPGFSFPGTGIEFSKRQGICRCGANKETYCASKRPNWPTPWPNVLMRLESEKTLDRTITDFGFRYLRPPPNEGALRCAFSLRRAVAEIRV